MRVLVTRPAAEAERTALRLGACGYEAVLAPVMRVVSIEAPPPAGRFDAVLVTSARAISPRMHEASDLLALPLFAVGRQTTRAAREAGFRDVRSAEGDGASLADLVTLTLPRPASLLYLAGHDRKPHIEARLHSAGCRLVVHETYRAERLAAWPEAVLQDLGAGAIAACLHFSRRSAALALALVEEAGLDAAFLSLDHCCISADAAVPLQEAAAGRGLAGLSIGVAERPDEASLIGLLPDRNAAPS